MRVAILDASAIATWLKLEKHINLFELLPNIMQYALVPEKVINEIENYAPIGQRPEQLNRFLSDIGTTETSFFRLCTALDTIILEEVSCLPKVDGGEAEAVAQGSKTGVNWILIDDKKCLPALTQVFQHYYFHNSLVLMAILAQTQLLPEPDLAFEKLNKVYNYNKKQHLQALEDAKKWLQI
jgi:predicted nucleic acid-binding protein